MTKGTEDVCMQIGYTEEQCKLIGKIDDMFEKAIELNLCSDEDAVRIGQIIGTVFGKYTGKLNI